jgi:hypothetical protein
MAVGWANDLQLGGYLKPGSPGIFVFEGEAAACDEFIKQLKAVPNSCLRYYIRKLPLFLSTLCIGMIALPRQARDDHRKPHSIIRIFAGRYQCVARSTHRSPMTAAAAAALATPLLWLRLWIGSVSSLRSLSILMSAIWVGWEGSARRQG